MDKVYICIMKEKEIYDNARIAIRNAKDPLAFLHLGSLYAQGVGTQENHGLANYFYDKAVRMECSEADEYIVREYELGARDISNDVEKMKDSSGALSLATIKKLIQIERTKGNSGVLSRLRDHLHSLYPNYDEKKAISDLLNNRDSEDADFYYATCTSNNQSEINLDQLDSLMSQLYAPITQDKVLIKKINDTHDYNILGKEAYDLLQCVENLNAAYDAVCIRYKIKKTELTTIESMDLFPYIKASTLPLLRKQGLRCLLSVKDVDPRINDKYLNCLESDEQLLNVCEEISNDEDLQLLLITYVELNIDIETLTFEYRSLMNAYRNKDPQPLAAHLNEFADRLSKAGIDHQLQEFTPEVLPPIKM